MGEQSAVIGEMGETTTKVKSDQNKKKQLLRSPCHCKQRKWKYGPRRATPRTTKSVEVAINGEQKSVSSGVSNQMAATPQRSRTITRESTGHEHRSDCGCTCGRLSGDVHMSSPRLTVSRLQEDRLQWWQCKQGVHEELKNYPYSSEGLSPTCTSVHCTLPTTNSTYTNIITFVLIISS